MQKLQKQYDVASSRVITCGTIEQMWALIKLAPVVVTDRYHPGVATHILGKGDDLLITEYKSENRKMSGLARMISKYSPSEIKHLNDMAFDMLKSVIIKHGGR